MSLLYSLLASFLLGFSYSQQIVLPSRNQHTTSIKVYRIQFKNCLNLSVVVDSSARLTRAYLTRAALTRAHLTRARLTRAHLTRAHLATPVVAALSPDLLTEDIDSGAAGK